MAERAHGTRAKYVIEKCRCNDCRKANSRYAASRLERAKQLAAQYPAQALGTVPVTKAVGMKGGRRGQTHPRQIEMRRACPGVHGNPCPGRRYLKSNSVGNICSDCREKLVRADLVPSERARRHILELSARGVGRDALHRACGISTFLIGQISRGEAPRIKPETEKKILSVGENARLDHSRIEANEAWGHIRWLLTVGRLSKSDIAARLGHQNHGLQVSRTMVLQKTLSELRRIHREVEADLLEDPGVRPERVEGALQRLIEKYGYTRSELAEALGWKNLKPGPLTNGRVPSRFLEEVLQLTKRERELVRAKPVSTICSTCGLPHDKASRLERLRRMLPCTLQEAMEAYPCTYPPARYMAALGHVHAPMMIFRDMRALGAVPGRGSVWRLPSGKADPRQETRPAFLGGN